jgi:hypothetical protein
MGLHHFVPDNIFEGKGSTRFKKYEPYNIKNYDNVDDLLICPDCITPILLKEYEASCECGKNRHLLLVIE